MFLFWILVILCILLGFIISLPIYIVGYLIRISTGIWYIEEFGAKQMGACILLFFAASEVQEKIDKND